MKNSSSSIFAWPLAEREGIDSFSSPFLLSFCLLVCLDFLALLGVKKGRNDTPKPKALCSTREKKVGKREREREGERPIYIYIYMRVSAARAFSVRRARTREEEEEEEE